MTTPPAVGIGSVVANAASARIEGFTPSNANANWISGDGHWDLGVHGKKLPDKHYRIAAYCFPGALYGDAETGFYGDPRTVLISIQYRY